MRLFDDKLSGTECLVLGVLALAVLSPVSCWRQEQDGRTELRVWCFARPQDLRLYEQAARAYERHHPDIRVTVSAFPGESYLQKLLPAMQAGAAGDVVLLHWSMICEVAAKGALMPLEDRVASDAYDVEDFFPGSMMPYIYDGHLSALPLRGSTMVLFYNKDLFDVAGVDYPHDDWTREDFLSAAQRLTIRENGRVVQIGCVPEEPTSWIHSAGGLYASDDLSSLRFTDPKTLDALQFYVDLRNRHRVTPANMGAGGQDPTGVNVFDTGRVAMLISGPWEVGTFSQIRDLRWDVALFPKGPGGRQTRYAGIGFGIWSGTSHPEASWDLVKYLCSAESSRLTSQLPTDIPARRSVAYSRDFLKPQYAWDMQVFLRAMEPEHTTLHVFPRSSLWSEVRRRFTRTLDEVLIEGKDLPAAMADLEEEVASYVQGRLGGRD